MPVDTAFYAAGTVQPGPNALPGVNGQVPSWNTNGTFAGWVTPSSPAGSGTELQYRNAGSFGAIAGSSWDGSMLKLSLGSSGALTPLAGTMIALEDNVDHYLTFMVPTANEAGLLWATPGYSVAGYIVYIGPTGAVPDSLIFGVDGGNSIFLSALNLALQGAFTISNSLGDLTIQSAGNLIVAGNGKIQYTQALEPAEVNNAPSGTTQTINWALGRSQKLDLSGASGAVTVTFSNPPSSGHMMLKVVQGVTARDVTWPAAVKWDDVVGEPTWASDTSKTRVVGMYYDGTNYLSAASDTFT